MVHEMTHDPAPASPTLTNPDMILPYSNPSPGSSTRISPPYLSLSMPSIGNITEADEEEEEQTTPTRRGVAMASGLYEHGAPLSDIGEEESVLGSRRSESGSATPIEDRSVASGMDYTWNVRRTKSDESMSTISGITDMSHWRDFDTGTPTQGSTPTLSRKGSELDLKPLPALPKDADAEAKAAKDEAESNALSERAERILANAKKRLTVGNNYLSHDQLLM